MFRKNKNTIIINGKRLNVSGNNIQISTDGIIVDGKNIDADFSEKIINIVIEGNVDRLKTSANATVNGNCGDVDCGGSCTVSGNVTGDIDAGGSVHCGNVSGNIDAGGSVTYKNEAF